MKKSDIELAIEELHSRMSRLEKEVGLPKLVPPGWHNARILGAERRESRGGKFYWALTIGTIENYPDLKLWMNLLERVQSPVEEVCSTFGYELRHDDSPPWPDTNPTILVGRKCRVRVEHEQFGTKTVAAVRDISPPQANGLRPGPYDL